MDMDTEKCAEKYIRDRLFELQDNEYKEFSAKLTPSVEKSLVIGVRTPMLRALAAELMKNEPKTALEYMKILPHKYQEENNLHGFLIERIRDYDETIKALDTFLPFVNNWATCDQMCPKIFKKHLPELLIKTDEWLASDEVYTIRFAIRMLMSFFLDEHFDPVFLKKVSAVKNEDYYVRMMIAWYFATALAKQWDAAVTYLDKHRLDTWTHNKTIRKAIESYRITPEQKAYLRGLTDKTK